MEGGSRLGDGISAWKKLLRVHRGGIKEMAANLKMDQGGQSWSLGKKIELKRDWWKTH